MALMAGFRTCGKSHDQDHSCEDDLSHGTLPICTKAKTHQGGNSSSAGQGQTVSSASPPDRMRRASPNGAMITAALLDVLRGFCCRGGACPEVNCKFPKEFAHLGLPRLRLVSAR